MKCVSCGAELRPEAKFCAACGAQVPDRCVACNAQLRSGAKFCARCGAVQQTAAPPAERPRQPAPERPAKPKKLPRWLWLLAAVPVPLVLCALCALCALGVIVNPFVPAARREISLAALEDAGRQCKSIEGSLVVHEDVDLDILIRIDGESDTTCEMYESVIRDDTGLGLKGMDMTCRIPMEAMTTRGQPNGDVSDHCSGTLVDAIGQLRDTEGQEIAAHGGHLARIAYALGQPATLDDAVIEIRGMMDQGKSREEIAQRVTQIADEQIRNTNSLERMTVGWNWMPLVESDEDKAFASWRDGGGGDKQYTTIAEWAWLNRYGQCLENASVVYYIMKQAGATDVRIMTRGEPDHAYVVWGMLPEADPNDPSSWTDDTIALDSWQGKTLRGDDALNDKYCGGGAKGNEDSTYLKDKTVPPPCGYRSTGSVKYPCCTKPPYAPCRGDARLVCLEGYCVSCGAINMPCCEGAVCNFDTLVCQAGQCVWCGGEDQPCCKENACQSGFECREGRCRPPVTATPTASPTPTAIPTPTPTPTPTPPPTPTPYTIGIFTVGIIPPNPGPDQDYQVQVVVKPPKEGIVIEIAISGTDDFAYSDVATTGEDGIVVFGPIPGGAAGVVETVVVTASDLDEQETFVFEF